MRSISDKWPWMIVSVLWLLWRIRSNPTRAGYGQLLRMVVLVGITLGATDLLTFRVLKPALSRPRPCYQLESVRLVTPSCGSDFGLPSNHAANAMAAATVVALSTRKRWSAGFFAVAGLIGFSRVYLGVHFPGDVILGYVAGASMGYLIFALYRLIRRPIIP